MPSKHYRWQTRWSVSLAAQSAMHDSGLIYDWAPGEAGPPPLWTLQAYDLAGVAWVGQVRGGAAGAQAWLATQPALRDTTSQRNRLLRLAREAGEAYAAALRGAVRVTVLP